MAALLSDKDQELCFLKLAGLLTTFEPISFLNNPQFLKNFFPDSPCFVALTPTNAKNQLHICASWFTNGCDIILYFNKNSAGDYELRYTSTLHDSRKTKGTIAVIESIVEDGLIEFSNKADKIIIGKDGWEKDDGLRGYNFFRHKPVAGLPSNKTLDNFVKMSNDKNVCTNKFAQFVLKNINHTQISKYKD